MPPGRGGEHPPARGPLDEALLQEIGLDHVFQRISAFRKRCRKRLDPHRPAAIAFGDEAQIAPVGDFILLMTELEITCGDIKNLLKLKRNHGYYSNMQQKYDNARLLNEIYCLKEQQKELDKKINFLIAHEELLKNENIILKKHINNMSIELHKLFTLNYSIIETSCHRKKRNFNEI